MPTRQKKWGRKGISAKGTAAAAQKRKTLGRGILMEVRWTKGQKTKNKKANILGLRGKKIRKIPEIMVGETPDLIGERLEKKEG